LYYCEHGGVDLIGLKPNLYNSVFLHCFDTVGSVVRIVKSRPQYNL